jgi:quercetin dioxygenase-like cupin family protein
MVSWSCTAKQEIKPGQTDNYLNLCKRQTYTSRIKFTNTTDMKQFTYPHTITNGGGEQLTFTKRLKDERGVEYLEAENLVQPNAGPPMHVHFHQEESLTVVKGKIGVQHLGGKEEIYGEGHTVTFKPGEAHRFWNAGTEPLICKGYVKPAHNVEYFLTHIFESTKQNGGERPATFDTAYLLNRYKSEFQMYGIPAFVRKVIFPISLFFGKLTGKDKKFKHAPEPVK